jgi:hypothetical protein
MAAPAPEPAKPAPVLLVGSVEPTPTVLVDAENVRRSAWPNVSAARLVELCRQWADRNETDVIVVFDYDAPREADTARCRVIGPGETADDWLAREARSFTPYWLVTSDRALRERAGLAAERTIGGGSFLRELLGEEP